MLPLSRTTSPPPPSRPCWLTMPEQQPARGFGATRAEQGPWSRRRDARATTKAGLRRPSRAGPSVAPRRLHRSRRPRGCFAGQPAARLDSRSVGSPASGRTFALRGSDSPVRRCPSSSRAGVSPLRRRLLLRSARC